MRALHRYLNTHRGALVPARMISNYTGVKLPELGRWCERHLRGVVAPASEGQFRVLAPSGLTDDEFAALSDPGAAARLHWCRDVIARSLESGEGARVEWKSRVPARRAKLAEEIAALATAGGGQIVLGVSDAGEVVGFFEERTAIRAALGMVEPRPQVTTTILRYQGVRLGVLAVEQGASPLYYANQKPYIRAGSVSRPAKPSEVYQIIKQHVLSGPRTASHA
jgi:hypothetical protein